MGMNDSDVGGGARSQADLADLVLIDSVACIVLF